jgi:hypothetical protein
MNRRLVCGFLPVLLVAAALSGCASGPRPSEQWLTGRHVGTVVDGASGKPLQGAQVRLVAYPEQRATTDAAGRFVLGPVKESRDRIRNLFGGVDAAACVDRIEVERAGYSSVAMDKGDDKTFKAACQNAVFEYRIYLNTAK